MKKLFFAAASLVLVGQAAHATINFSDDFNSYTNGNLAGTSQDAVGQGTWKQTSTSATSPVQINNGAVTLGTSGQDIYSPLTTPISLTDGTSFYIGLDVSVTSAQAGGDYFLHWSTPAGTTGTFIERLYIKSSGSGFVFGYDGSSGGTVNYSSSVLNFNTDYRLVLSYTAVAGTVNDTFALYLNPTDGVEGDNTAYMTSGYVGTGAEANTVSAINFRQGSAGSAPALTADNLVVATTFGEAAAVPEPAVASLCGLAALGFYLRFRKKNS